VEDAARVFSVISGYDPKDPLTAFAAGRKPEQPYETFTHETTLKGLRIGVVREYMDKALFTKADEAVDRSSEFCRGRTEKVRRNGDRSGRARGTVHKIYSGAGAGAAGRSVCEAASEAFPVDENKKPTGDHLATLVDYVMDPTKAPGKFTLRDLGRVAVAAVDGAARVARWRRCRRRGGTGRRAVGESRYTGALSAPAR